MKQSGAASHLSAAPLAGRRWLAAASLAVGILAGLVLLAPAHAQERPRTLFEFLFPGSQQQQRQRQREPERRPAATTPQPQATPRRATPRTTAAPRAAPAQPAAPEVVEKADDARVLLVIGDFIGGGLAEGLSAAYADDPTIRVVDHTNGSSGFVRDDYYNWPAEIGAILESVEPTVVAVLLGSNDRQQMLVGGSREAPRTDPWNEEYARRATAVAAAFAERNIPFVWIGLPPFKVTRMSSDMLAFNDIQRGVAEAAGGTFVDIWEGFVDEAGAFVTNGPDINGQPARLRAGDGINFTQSGKRKIAFYAEKPLNRILETGSPGAVAAPGFPMLGAPDAFGHLAPGEPPPIDRTVPISLNDPDFDGGAELLGLIATPKREDARTPSEKLVIEGVAPPAMPGRVDDFSVRPRPAVVAKPVPAAPAPRTGEPATAGERERTSSIAE
jgi:hypothetical protein